MSLINEALRRARLEAARQEAARRGEPQPVLPSALPDRRRFPWGLFALALAIGIVLTATAIWLMDWNRQAPATPREAAAASATPAPRATTASKAPSIPVRTAKLPPSGTVEPAGSKEASVEPSSMPPKATERESSKPPEQARKANRNVASQARPPEHDVSTSASSLIDGYTYVGSIDTHGHHLVLGGIAWSSSHPTAVLNDAAVGKGDEVAGVHVLAVEPDRVKLAAEGKTFFLRLP